MSLSLYIIVDEHVHMSIPYDIENIYDEITYMLFYEKRSMRLTMLLLFLPLMIPYMPFLSLCATLKKTNQTEHRRRRKENANANIIYTMLHQSFTSFRRLAIGEI